MSRELTREEKSAIRKLVFSRVMLNMEQATNWDVQTMDNLRHYFGNILKPYIEKQARPLCVRTLKRSVIILATARISYACSNSRGVSPACFSI